MRSSEEEEEDVTAVPAKARLISQLSNQATVQTKHEADMDVMDDMFKAMTRVNKNGMKKTWLYRVVKQSVKETTHVKAGQATRAVVMAKRCRHCPNCSPGCLERAKPENPGMHAIGQLSTLLGHEVAGWGGARPRLRKTHAVCPDAREHHTPDNRQGNYP
jgi:hypothetical protein